VFHFIIKINIIFLKDSNRHFIGILKECVYFEVENEFSRRPVIKYTSDLKALTLKIYKGQKEFETQTEEW
jgi:hypothetical protein